MKRPDDVPDGPRPSSGSHWETADAIATRRDPRSRTLGLLLTALVLGGLAMTDLWLQLREQGQVSASGTLAGLGAAGLLAMLYQAGATRSQVASTIAAGLLGLGEFLLGVLVLGAVMSAVVVALPHTQAAKLDNAGVLTELVVMAFVGLALWVAARSWWSHARHQALAAQAEARAAQALALVAERERALARSELQLLRAQVEPHFLWNTLGNVQHLIRKDPVQADRLTGLLIRYLRASLPRIRQDSSTLREEFACARTYLELMCIRMGERLTMSVDLPTQLEEAPLAPLLLQTLVENAIRQGVEPKVGSVEVRVTARRLEDGRIGIAVADNGVGLVASAAPAATAGTGLGLRSVRERLTLLHGDRSSLSITQRSEGGVVATIIVPGELPAAASMACMEMH